MCTVKEIQEAIREDCKSQYDMESTDIDRVMQTLPFAQEEPFTAVSYTYLTMSAESQIHSGLQMMRERRLTLNSLIPAMRKQIILRVILQAG